MFFVIEFFLTIASHEFLKNDWFFINHDFFFGRNILRNSTICNYENN